MRETVDYTNLVGKAKGGDEAAFRELYSATVKSAYHTASLMLKNPDDIEDVLQNAYMKAAKNLAELRNPESFDSWFRSIIENESRNYIKKEKKFRIPVLFSGSRPENNAEWKQPVPQEFMEREELREQVSRIVDSLSAEVRACIVLFHYEDKSISEISAILDIPEGTVKSRLHNGRKKVEKEFGKLLKKDPTLYGIGAIPLILSFMAYQAENITVPAAIAEGAASAAATTVSTAAAGASASAGAAGATTAVTSGATVAASAGAGTAAAATIAVKVTAAAVAGCVAVGGTAAIKSQVDRKREEAASTSSYITTVKTEETCTVAETLTAEFTTLQELSQIVSSVISSTAVTSRAESSRYTTDEETTEENTASEKTTKKKASTTAWPSTTATTNPATTRKPTTARPSTTKEIITEETTEEETTTRRETTKATTKPTTTKPTTTEKNETTKEQTTSPENNYGTSGGVITEYTGGETSVSVPSKIGSQTVTAIGSGAFSGNEDIKSVSIPSSVTQIGQEAFSDCTSLSSVSLPSSLKQIGIGAFYGCSSLSSVTVPSGTTTIGDEAFAYCTSLRTVTIPSSVTSIADDAFTGCDSLTIRCEEGSAAHEFAVANGIAYTV